jgi:hypothetical protein
MYEIIVAIILLLVLFKLWTYRPNQVSIRVCPPEVLLTYQKVSGAGRIYELDVRTDGKYSVFMIQGHKIMPLKAGMLNLAQFEAYKRLLRTPPKSCLYAPTIADSIISRIIYRSNGKPVAQSYLGVLDSHALPPRVFDDVITLDSIINMVA